MLDIIARLFHRAEERQETSCEWHNTGFGLLFKLPGRTQKQPVFEYSLAALQRVLLQQLVEAGEAKSNGEDTEIEAESACRLDETARDILKLPPPWQGRMELVVRGRSTEPSFSLGIRLCEARGLGEISYQRNGPILHAAGEDYLLDAAQWQAFSAVSEHEDIPEGARSEADNLRAVLILQDAVQHGLDMDLRVFSGLQVTVPEHVGITVCENNDGSIRLVPTPDGIPPEQLEPRLGQLLGSNVLRAGSKIVLLDERHIQAVKEILSSRVISRKDKARFFQTPTAWLDATLVDLDLGFSARMHGMQVFKKAYFGLTEPSELSWFGEEGDMPQLLPLGACAGLISSDEDLAALQAGVSRALEAGLSVTDFKDNITVLLPDSATETDVAMQNIVMQWCEKQAGTGEASPREEAGSSESEQPEAVQIAVDIDLHDTCVEGDGKAEAAAEQSLSYSGELCTENLKYTFKPYQEEGTRWILGLMGNLLQDPAQRMDQARVATWAPAGDGPGRTVSADGNREAARKSTSAGALLADDMGLGKTFMVLAALNVLLATARRQNRTCKPILVVMPVVLLENWRDEIDRVFREMPFKDIVILQAGADLGAFRKEKMGRESLARGEEDMPSMERGRYSLKIGKAFGANRLDLPERIVLTNYDTLRDYQFSLSLVDWGCVVFDEAQEIRNPNTLKSRAARALRTDFCLAMTGTPVENSLTDFWSLFDTVKPGLLGSFQDFNKTWVQPVSSAMKQGKTDEAQQLRISLGRNLRDTAGHYMLRRTKEEKLDGLPRKIVHDGALEPQYSAEMSGEQLARYNSVVNGIAMARADEDGARLRTLLLPSLRSLQNVSLYPDLLAGEPALPNSGAEYTDVRKLLTKSAKLELLLNILDEIRDRDEKVIIFVINRTLQRFLATTLECIYKLPNISIVNGETPSVTRNSSGRQLRRTGQQTDNRSRIERIRDFEKQPGFQIICMSPLAAGVGLTVTGANNVVHLERHWNPAREAQATDRVYRIGATKDVHVYLPLLRHPTLMSFDENLNELLRRKTELKDAVMTVEEVQAADFDRQKLFGTEILPSARVTSEWLKTMNWEFFEAVTACLASRIFGGTSWLTKRSGDHGADVVVCTDRENVIIECKLSRHAYGDSEAACRPYTACREYANRLGKPFNTPVLAVNAPSVAQNVRDRADSLGVTIWDRPFLAEELDRQPLPCHEVESMLHSERLV